MRQSPRKFKAISPTLLTAGKFMTSVNHSADWLAGKAFVLLFSAFHEKYDNFAQPRSKLNVPQTHVPDTDRSANVYLFSSSFFFSATHHGSEKREFERKSLLLNHWTCDELFPSLSRPRPHTHRRKNIFCALTFTDNFTFAVVVTKNDVSIGSGHK